eukprot:scaffold297595_cov142-Cyclotella_meneghiniana.AAC.3
MVGAIDGVVVHLPGREKSNSATLHVFPRDALQTTASFSSNTERVAWDSRHRHPFGDTCSPVVDSNLIVLPVQEHKFAEGDAVTGLRVGEALGIVDGEDDGLAVAGFSVGEALGIVEGELDGLAVMGFMVGEALGIVDGEDDGLAVMGFMVGEALGIFEGELDGLAVTGFR